MQYASETTVSVAKSRAEIESTVTRYGASEFISGWSAGFAQVAFQMKNRQIRFMLPLPNKSDDRFLTREDGRSGRRTPNSAEKIEALWEQACRQRWRALLLVIKAKLEAVECAISTFDSEFMSNIVLSDGLTIGEKMLDKEGKLLPAVVGTGNLPRLLPGPSHAGVN
jgi:hypothetical protein